MMADSNMLRKEIYKELRTQIELSRKRVYDIIILLQSALDTKELFLLVVGLLGHLDTPARTNTN